MAKKNKTKPRAKIKLRPGRTSSNLGGLAAENDSELATYYVKKDKYVGKAINVDDNASFFVGPKGSGKSAILQMMRMELKGTDHRIIEISPAKLAFNALAHLDASASLLTNPNHKQWLYKSLWQYILSIEIGTNEYTDEGKFRS